MRPRFGTPDIPDSGYPLGLGLCGVPSVDDRAGLPTVVTVSRPAQPDLPSRFLLVLRQNRGVSDRREDHQRGSSTALGAR